METKWILNRIKACGQNQKLSEESEQEMTQSFYPETGWTQSRKEDITNETVFVCHQLPTHDAVFPVVMGLNVTMVTPASHWLSLHFSLLSAVYFL